MKRRIEDMRYPETGQRRIISRVALAAVAIVVFAVGVIAIRRVVAKVFGARRRGTATGRPDTVRGPRAFADVLRGHRYMNLTTYRRNGEAVLTTVWFALVDGDVYVTTDPRSGKMKRIRNDPRVALVPSNAWGAPRGASVEGIGRIVEGDAPGRAERALREKYRVELALFRLFGREEIGHITLKIQPAGSGAGL